MSVPQRDIMLTEARIHDARGRTEEAIRAYTRALHAHPDNLRIAYKLADLHYQERHYEKALGILKGYLDRSTPRRNLYYPVGLCYHKLGKLRYALGAYTRALQIDPGHLRAYVRLAQVRIRQGLPYDAAKVLQRALRVDPEYLPALEELKVANRLIQGDHPQVYRKRNLVVLFHDHRQYQMIDRAFPTLERARRRIEEELRYHIPVIWIKVENKVRRFGNPPALYDAPEDSVIVEAAALEAGNYAAVVHQMVHMYLEKLTEGRLPHWLAEGLALDYARPDFLERTPLRSTSLFPVGLSRNAFVERSYLDFDEADEDTRRALAKSFVLARYLEENYGLPGIRKLLHVFRSGEKNLEKALWKALRIEMDDFRRKTSIYAMRGYYFAPSTLTLHP